MEKRNILYSDLSFLKTVKLKALMETIIMDKVFELVVAHVRVIKFQKRELPHAHCIFVLDQASKNVLRNTEREDTVTLQNCHLRMILS